MGPGPPAATTDEAGLNAEGARQLALRWLRDHAATPRSIVGEPMEAASAWAFRVEADTEFETEFGLLVVDKFDAYMEQWQPDEDGGWPDAYEQSRPVRVASQLDLEAGARRLRLTWSLACTAVAAVLVAGLVLLTAAGSLSAIATVLLLPCLLLLWAYALSLFPKAVDRMRRKERARLLESGERRGWPT